MILEKIPTFDGNKNQEKMEDKQIQSQGKKSNTKVGLITLIVIVVSFCINVIFGVFMLFLGILFMLFLSVYRFRKMFKVHSQCSVCGKKLTIFNVSMASTGKYYGICTSCIHNKEKEEREIRKKAKAERLEQVREQYYKEHGISPKKKEEQPTEHPQERPADTNEFGEKMNDNVKRILQVNESVVAFVNCRFQEDGTLALTTEDRLLFVNARVKSNSGVSSFSSTFGLLSITDFRFIPSAFSTKNGRIELCGQGYLFGFDNVHNGQVFVNKVNKRISDLKKA